MAQYIIPKARDLRSGQSVVEHDLSGVRFQPHQRRECQQLADRLAQKLEAKTGRQWQGYCAAYDGESR